MKLKQCQHLCFWNDNNCDDVDDDDKDEDKYDSNDDHGDNDKRHWAESWPDSGFLILQVMIDDEHVCTK